MKEQEENKLNIVKNDVESSISVTENLINKLELNPTVIDYLEKLKLLKKLEQKKKFINELEIGEDGTFFTSSQKYSQKGLSSTYFGLSIILTNAFNLLSICSSKKLLSYKEIVAYTKNAQEKLQRMYYIEGYKKITNSFGLDVYENPQNYSVIDFEEICLSLTQKKLEEHYNVPGIVIRPELRTFEINNEYLMEENPDLPLRIQEAFYGIDAQRILGINENKKEKVYKK